MLVKTSSDRTARVENESNEYVEQAGGSQFEVNNSNVATNKKRRPIPTNVVRHQLYSGQWWRRPLSGSSIRFRFFDELMENNTSLEMLICRLCDSAYSIHSRSHCLDHIKQRHADELLTAGLADNEEELAGDNNFYPSTSRRKYFRVEDEEDGDDEKVLNSGQPSPYDHERFPMSMSMFESMPSTQAHTMPQTSFVKRRRLITTEMAKIRLETGEWQLRSVPGASVRCRFFYEIFDGEIPLNTLSCKICGATYSVQSRSHYREHVRRRHSEVYCVRNGRGSNNTQVDMSNNSALFNADDLLNAESPYDNANGADYGPDADLDTEDADCGFSLHLQNVSGFGLGGNDDSDNMLLDLEESGNFGSVPGSAENPQRIRNGIKMQRQTPNLNAYGKVRRLVTTDTATVMRHLDAGDWQRKIIPGVSIRSRFFVEIVDGDKSLNILLCKVCGSTYSAQSRSHCVEHVKKRHQSILEGHTEQPDFDDGLWRQTRRPSPTTLQSMPVPYTIQNRQHQSASSSSRKFFSMVNGSSNSGNGSAAKTPLLRPKMEPESSASLPTSSTASMSSSTFATSGARKRKRPPIPLITATGPDQTIETPSFDDVLQSIASQVLLNGDEDVKFDLDELNKIQSVKSAGTNFDDKCDVDYKIGAGRTKRRILDAALDNTTNDILLAREGSTSPPHLSGGINAQLFALSEMGFAEAEQQRAAEEAAAAAAEAAKTAAEVKGNGGKLEKLMKNNVENAISQENNKFAPNKLSHHYLSNQKKQRQQQKELGRGFLSSTSSSPAPPQLSAEGGIEEVDDIIEEDISEKGSHHSSSTQATAMAPAKKSTATLGQKLNHQQLLMAARTAALVSGSADDEATEESSAHSPKGNGADLRSSNISQRGKDFYGVNESNGYYPPFSSSSRHHGGYAESPYNNTLPGMVGGLHHPHSHPYSNRPFNYHNQHQLNNYYGMQKQQQQQQWLHRREMMMHQQHHSMVSSPHMMPPGMRSFTGPSSLYGGPLNGSDGSSGEFGSSNSAGLLSPGLLHSRVISTIGNSGALNHGGYNVVDGAINGCDGHLDDSSFCNSCKSEFPNVLRGLNQLYSRVNDLIDVVRLALSQSPEGDSLRANGPALTRALRRLDATAQSGNAAVHSFSANAARRSAVVSNRPTVATGTRANDPITRTDTVKKIDKSSNEKNLSTKIEKFLEGTSAVAETSNPNSNVDEAAPSLQRMDCELLEDEDVENAGEETEEEEKEILEKCQQQVEEGEDQEDEEVSSDAKVKITADDNNSIELEKEDNSSGYDDNEPIILDDDDDDQEENYGDEEDKVDEAMESACALAETQEICELDDNNDDYHINNDEMVNDYEVEQ